MSNSMIKPEQLESLFLKNWAEFIDKTELIRKVLVDARDADLQIVEGRSPVSQLSITITKFSLIDNSNFEVFVEFAVPKDNAMIVGSHIYLTNCSGNFQLQDTYGVIFRMQNS